ncbi:MAG: hypothetical protein HY928_00155 [Elusimicrobia bacterium]|nr:hypothetical protein [Elusimicrobiota bacterium]
MASAAVSADALARGHPRSGARVAFLQDPFAQPDLPSGKSVSELPFPVLRYERATGGPFNGELAWHNVVQGLVGSCFFLSALAALAMTRPEHIRSALLDNHDGTFAVTLYGVAGKPVFVGVDDRLPTTGSGEPAFARGPALWPALFEKAYAKLLGGYSVLNDGGIPADALRTLTGGRAHTYFPARRSLSSLWEILVEAQKSRRPMVASTLDKGAMTKVVGDVRNIDLLENHAYAVRGVYESAGRRMIRLYTPLSTSDAGRGRAVPRLIDVSLEEFRAFFPWLTVGSL